MKNTYTLVAAMALLVTACDNDTLEVGQSLTEQNDKLNIVSTTVMATSRTYKVDSVLSLTSTCYLGRVMDPLTRAVVQTDFTTQFHPLELFYISPSDSILSRWNGMAAADSCDLVFFLSSPFYAADSLTSMKIKVSELSTPAEEGLHYYTNFDPSKRGMVRTAEGAVSVEKMFSYRDLLVKTSTRDSSGYLNNIHVTLRQPYTDKDGRQYNNYGTYLMQQYYQDEQNFRNIWRFTHHVCPGIAVELTDGLGFHAQVTDIGLRIYYMVKNDSVYRGSAILAGTHEVLQTTRVVNDNDVMQQLTDDPTCTYIKSPAGLLTEVTLPIEQIKSGHGRDSLIAARIDFQRINNESTAERQFNVPSTLLMVEKDSLNAFFERNKLIDNRSSFIASLSSATNVYSYTNISNMVTSMWNRRTEGLKNDPQWVEKHPDWNRVLLVPVKTTYTSSGTLTGVEHSMSLSSTRLAGGTQGGGIEMSLVYARFDD